MKLTTYLPAMPAALLSATLVVEPGHLVSWAAIVCWGTFLYCAHEDLTEILGLVPATAYTAQAGALLAVYFGVVDGAVSLLAALTGLSMAVGFAHLKELRRPVPALASCRADIAPR